MNLIFNKAKRYTWEYQAKVWLVLAILAYGVWFWVWTNVGWFCYAAKELIQSKCYVAKGIDLVWIADLGPQIKLKTYEEKWSLGQALRLGRAQYVSMDLRDKSQVEKGNLIDLKSLPRQVISLLNMNNGLFIGILNYKPEHCLLCQTLNAWGVEGVFFKLI